MMSLHWFLTRLGISTVLLALVFAKVGCGDSAESKVSARTAENLVDADVLGDWQFRSEELDSIFNDSFASAFVTGRTIKYEQQGMSSKKARAKAEADYRKENPGGAQKHEWGELPKLSINEDQRFVIQLDGKTLLAGHWRITESNHIALDLADTDESAEFQYDTVSNTLEVVSGTLFVPEWGALDDEILTKRED